MPVHDPDWLAAPEVSSEQSSVLSHAELNAPDGTGLGLCSATEHWPSPPSSLQGGKP